MTTTSISPTARLLWTRHRGLLAALLILLVFALAYAAVRSGEHHGRLDPRSADRHGSRATAELLRDRGVTVDFVATTADAAAAAGPGTTLLVALPDRLTSRQIDFLRDATPGGAGRTVLVAPGPEAVEEFAPGVRAVAATGVGDLAPDCDLPAARRAGTADLGGYVYDPSGAGPGTQACYPSSGLPSLLRVPDRAGPGDTVVLGAPDPLYNHRLDDRGNASLTLQLLGSHPRLVWYLPSPSDDSVGGGDESFLDLVPDNWRWGAWQLGVAAAVAALWRARRLGPVVPEPLPVTVRAAEATEGRARLYRRAGARARAAEALRQAARARLGPLVGVPLSRVHDPEALVPAVAAHVDAPAPQVRSLLYGPAPEDDTALVRLADDLDALTASLHDWQVRST
ncbi:DUF4350 domain-containing protein [Streptomyces capparidis]